MKITLHGQTWTILIFWQDGRIFKRDDGNFFEKGRVLRRRQQ
jgi:hypothetical protein